MQRRFTAIAARSLLACVPALGLVMAVGAGTASAAKAPAAKAPAAKAPANARVAAAIRALEHLKVGRHATAQLTGRAIGVPGAALKQVTSTNWSGYADTATSSKYSKVTGSWTEPRGTCGSQTSLAAFWVGIDGYSSGTVEQDGTLIECVGGTPSYFTWWEMYPTNAIQVVGSSLAPGDQISASVVRTGTSYALTVTDSTHPANSFSLKRSCGSCADSSSEWIAEAPSNSSGVLPLTNFGTWTLKGATVTAGSTNGTISSFPDAEITMINKAKKVKAQPGPLNAAGNQFTVTFKSST